MVNMIISCLLTGTSTLDMQSDGPLPQVIKMRGVQEFCQWDGNGVEYAVVGGLGGVERARREGGRYSAKNQRPSHWGSVSVNEMRGVLDFG